MNSQFRKGAIELCVLALLKQKDLYGYEMIRELSKKFPITADTVYPILKRLTKSEFLSSYMMESFEGPARKYYKITHQGEAYYSDLKTEWINFTEKVADIINERKL
ncbi:MAG: PadR family transcriptional regulator [Bacillota bacterium]